MPATSVVSLSPTNGFVMLVTGGTDVVIYEANTKKIPKTLTIVVVPTKFVGSEVNSGTIGTLTYTFSFVQGDGECDVRDIVVPDPQFQQSRAFTFDDIQSVFVRVTSTASIDLGKFATVSVPALGLVFGK